MRNHLTSYPTNDKLIRSAFRENLRNTFPLDEDAKIIDELGVTHGAARVDIAVINESIHGYELKSDKDTLDRLPDQMKYYNSVFDRITLVVGKSHLFEAIKLVPEWWGIIVAKTQDSTGKVVFFDIRTSEENPEKQNVPLARLLWRHEALIILEKLNKAKGIRSKSRELIYERLASTLDAKTLGREVRKCLVSRTNWRS